MRLSHMLFYLAQNGSDQCIGILRFCISYFSQLLEFFCGCICGILSIYSLLRRGKAGHGDAAKLLQLCELQAAVISG